MPKLSEKEIHQFYDKTYTKLFSHKRVTGDFIRGFIKEDFAGDIELVEKMETKFITKRYKKYESDLIWKARFKEKEIYLYILIEFQTANDDLITLRVLNYITLFYLYLSKKSKRTPPFPPVLPIVIHIGEDRFTRYLKFRRLIDIPYVSLRKYIPSFRYFLLDLNLFPRKELAKLTIHTKNMASLLFEMDKYDEEELLENFGKVLSIIKTEAPSELLKDFQEYIIAILSSERKEEIEMIETLDKEPSMLYKTMQRKFESIRKTAERETWKKAEEKIKESKEELIKIVKNMYKNGLDVEIISTLTEKSVEEVKKILGL
jgi:predicted transposase/invertase (TIGR01784 family)